MASASGLRADVTILFDNGVGAGAGAGVIGGSDIVGNLFTPTQSGTANTLAFTEVNGNTTDAFTAYLYSGVPSPGTLIGTSTLSGISSVTIAGPKHEYTATLDTPFTLSTSSTYFLGINDATTSNASLIQVSSAAPATSRYISTDGGTTFSGPTTVSVGFTLSNTSAVPEPANWGWLLGGLGLLALGTRRKTA